MNILPANQQKTFTTPNAVVVPLATPSLGSQSLSVIRPRMPPQHQNPLHTQTHEEVMVMLSGKMSVQVAGEWA